MKKITFILFAFIAGTAFGQTTIDSSAEIIAAISFEENTPLNFGRVDNTAGTVGISTAGAVTGKTQIPGAGPTPGKLTVTGEPNELYFFTVSETATLTEAASSQIMNVQAIVHDATEKLDDLGKEVVIIGGELTVTEGQATGTYFGTISVTVSYN